MIRVILLLLGPFALLAHSEHISMTYHLPPIQRLQLRHIRLNFPKPTADDMERGFVEMPDAISAEISSNVAWKLFLVSRDGQMEGKKGQKPLQDFRWRPSGTQDYRALSDDMTLVASSKTFCKKKGIHLDCQVLIDWENATPDHYGVGVKLLLLPFNE